VDLLLGWSLEPSLSDGARDLIPAAFAAIAPCWQGQQQQQVISQVARKVLADLEQLAPQQQDGKEQQQQVDQQEQERLVRFCALASCLVAIVQGVSAHAPAACEQGSALEGLPEQLLQLLLVVQRRAATVVEAGGGSGGAMADVACSAAQLALRAAAAAGGSGSCNAAEAASAALHAAIKCLKAPAAPRLHTLQLLHATASLVRASAQPGAAQLQRAVAAAWSLLLDATEGLRASAHTDVVKAAAAVCLAALDQGGGTAVGAAAAEHLLQEVQRLQQQLVAERVGDSQPAAEPGMVQGSYAEQQVSSEEGESSNGDGEEEEEGGAGAVAAVPDALAAAPASAAGMGQQQRRLLAFDLALLQAWMDSGAGAAAASAAAASLSASTTAAAVAVTVLRCCCSRSSAPDAELADLCVRLLAALCRRACAVEEAEQRDTPSQQQQETAGVGESSSGAALSTAVQVMHTASEGLQLAFDASLLPTPVRQAALQAIITAAQGALSARLRSAAAVRAAAMAQRASTSSQAALRLVAVSAARSAADAALQHDVGGCIGSSASGDGSSNNARALVLGAGTVLLTLASDADAPIASAAQSALCTLSLPVYLLAAAPCSGGPTHSSPAAACDPLAPARREGVALQHQLRGFRPAQLSAVFEDLLQASPSLTLLTKQSVAAAGGGEDGGASIVDAQLLQLARELPVLPSSIANASGSDPGGTSEPHPKQQKQKQSSSHHQHKASPALDPDHMSSSAEAAWYLAQEAARHCIAARMKTHMGGPTQSFAALEKLLQGALSRLQAAGQQQARSGTAAAGGGVDALGLKQRHGAAHLVEFVFALEAGIYNAAEGCLDRVAPSQGVMAFFVANKRVSHRAVLWQLLGGRAVSLCLQLPNRKTTLPCGDNHELTPLTPLTPSQPSHPSHDDANTPLTPGMRRVVLPLPRAPPASQQRRRLPLPRHPPRDGPPGRPARSAALVDRGASRV